MCTAVGSSCFYSLRGVPDVNSIVTKTVRAFSAFEMVEIISQNSKPFKKLFIGFEISVRSSAFHKFWEKLGLALIFSLLKIYQAPLTVKLRALSNAHKCRSVTICRILFLLLFIGPETRSENHHVPEVKTAAILPPSSQTGSSLKSKSCHIL